MDIETVALSKYISYLLRHNPSDAGVALDKEGWADTEELLAGIRRKGRKIDLQLLEKIVQDDEKGRYSFSSDKTRIRANQGHSIPVHVAMTAAVPPEILYHGTAEQFAERICAEGIKKMSRQFVHLSPDIATACKVGQRHGKVCVFAVKAGEMAKDGFVFFLSANGVWQSEDIPPAYIEKILF